MNCHALCCPVLYTFLFNICCLKAVTFHNVVFCICVCVFVCVLFVIVCVVCVCACCVCMCLCL